MFWKRDLRAWHELTNWPMPGSHDPTAWAKCLGTRGWPPKSRQVDTSSAGMIWDHITALESSFQLIVIVVIIIVIVVVIIVNEIQDVSTFQLAFTVRLPEGSLEIEVNYSTRWCLTVTSWCITDITLIKLEIFHYVHLAHPTSSRQCPHFRTRRANTCGGACLLGPAAKRMA